MEKRTVKLLLKTIIITSTAACFLIGVYSVFYPIENMHIYSLLYNIGKFCGLTGFILLGILVISGDSARWFDKIFGIDKIIKFQRKFSIVTLFFVLLHPMFFILSDTEIIKYMIPDYQNIPLATGIIGLYLFSIIMVCSVIYKRISHEIWQLIHILIYVMFISSLFHAINIGSDSEKIGIKIIYFSLSIGVLVSSLYRLNYKIRQRKLKFYVEKIKKETKECSSIVLRTNNKLNFKAGQFCFLRLQKPKLYARHPFTISSRPNEKNLRFTFKKTGRFTEALSKLKKGEEVVVDGPFGQFFLDNDEEDLVFIAGGVGITPFISMIMDQQEKRFKKNITLLYGCRKENEIIFRKELDKIKDGWLKKVYVLSDEKSEKNMFEKGLIDKEIIKRYAKNINRSRIYICGPEAMKKKVLKDLSQLGVEKRKIYWEDFFW